MTIVTFALASILLQQPLADSSAAIQRAERVIVEYYADMSPDPEPCNGLFFGDCSVGEWRWPFVMHRERQAEARGAVIRELDALSAEAGNSEWVHRQRVAFAIRHGDYRRASRIAATCDNSASWCWTLRGLTEHLLVPGNGIAEFDSAFALMGAEGAYDSEAHAACRWADPRDVLPVELEQESQNRGCPSRNDSFKRFWWLSDPLWSVPGNERYAEHLARRVMVRMDRDLQPILDRAVGKYRILAEFAHSDSSYAFAIRQGFPNSRSAGVSEVCPTHDCIIVQQRYPQVQAPSNFPRMGDAYVRGGYSFTPNQRTLAEPVRSSSDDWAVTWLGVGCKPPWSMEICGIERMVPRRVWHNLDHQTAVFRRGTQLLVASAAYVADSIGRAESLNTALVLGSPEAMRTRVFDSTLDSDRVLRTAARVDVGAYIASIEVVGPETVARARFGIPQPGVVTGFGLSDVALVAERDSADLPVERYMFPSERLHAGEPLRIYFEVYELDSDENIEVALRVDEARAGWTGRLVRWLGLRSGDASVVAQWQEQADRSSGTISRYYEIDTRSLANGEHQIAVTVTRSDGTHATASRTFVLH